LAPVAPKRPAVARFPYERLSDAELVQAIAQGDATAMGIVWDRYSPLVRTVLRGTLGGDASVEDLLQEVFVAFLRSAERLREASSLRAWLVSVAVRLLLVELRRRKVRRWVMLSADGKMPDVPLAPADLDGMAVLRALYRLLDQLPARRRLVFVLRHVQGMEVLEVAEALGISDSTAKREAVAARRAILARAKLSEPALAEYLRGLEDSTDD